MLGVVLLCGSGLVPVSFPREERSTEKDIEPVAAMLKPLGPIRAMVSSMLWMQYLRGQLEGDAAQVGVLSRALLQVHPGLEEVRHHLAYQLMISEARRAPDRQRYRVLLAAGLRLIDEGLDRSSSPYLSGAAGTILYQGQNHVWFAEAIEELTGETLESLAIDYLRGGRHDDPTEVMLLAGFLVERGLRVLLTDAAVSSARSDYEEACALLEAVSMHSPEQVDALLDPLADLLLLTESGGDPRSEDPFRDSWQLERSRSDDEVDSGQRP